MQRRKRSEVVNVIYANTEKTSDMIPLPSPDDWKWECTGTQGVDFNLDPMGNEARYTHLSGDFMDRIITAKCKIDAGIFTGKKSSKAVDRFVWVEGDVMAPLSLVNEEGRRIKYVPLYVPNDGKGCGFPPNYGDPVKVNINFLTEYNTQIQDLIRMIPRNPLTTTEIELIFDETDVDSRHFVARNESIEIVVHSPMPSDNGRIATVKRPGEERMRFDLIIGGTSIPMDIPLWMGPGIGTDEIQAKEAKYYGASNAVFTPESCETIDQSQYNNKNAKFFFQVFKPGFTDIQAVVKVQTNFVKDKEIICEKVKNWTYRSEAYYVVPSHYDGETVPVGSNSYHVLKSDTSIENYSMFRCWGVAPQIKEDKKIVKKAALAVCAYNPFKKGGLTVLDDEGKKKWKKYFGVDFESDDEVSLYLFLLTLIELVRLYNVTVTFAPLGKDFEIPNPKFQLTDYDMFYYGGHGGVNPDKGPGVFLYASDQEFLNGAHSASFYQRTIETNVSSGTGIVNFVVMHACSTAGTSHNMEAGDIWRKAFGHDDKGCYIGFHEDTYPSLSFDYLYKVFQDIANHVVANKTRKISEAMNSVPWPGSNCRLYGDYTSPYSGTGVKHGKQ
ncbi:MAG: hypothetical protein PHQ23_09455 [Candidatus Wallbacteria bacterium]|nr:hypothetical protein [Candidatus Wallbacteria bacterium]